MIPLDIWPNLKAEAKTISELEPILANYAAQCVLQHDNFSDSLSFVLAHKLADALTVEDKLFELFHSFYHNEPEVLDAVTADLAAVYDRDPAITSYLTVLLNLKGFQAIQIHRLAHHLWQNNRKELALYIQSRNSEVMGVDIHPACKIGKGVMFDHATGIVIGETAVIEDNVSILQSVTLGGTGNESGDRHPKVRHGVMIGAGTQVLGNIEIGYNSKIGAGSVVLKDVKPHTTVVGVPAKQVGIPRCPEPCSTMDQNVLNDVTSD